MKIFSDSIVNGYIKPEIGKLGTQFIKGRMPSWSPHLAWRELPKNTKSLAITFLDYDAVPVCGFTWIHWIVANIDSQLGELSENSSVDGDLIEGVNSWASKFLPDEFRLDKSEATAFGGCAPPDKPHQYTITVYALDSMLDLEHGFYLNELLKAMEGHTLASATLKGIYRHE